MHIMTERGWRPLQTPITNVLVEAPPRYRGPLPSAEAMGYIAKLQGEHEEWIERRKELLAH